MKHKLEIISQPPQGNPFQDHARFMEACGQTTMEHNLGQARLYLNLIHEEFGELLEADSEHEAADAVIDLLVVLIGYGFSRGWPMAALWNEVHRSNMAKVGPDGRVTRREDGKILKPADWTPPDLHSVINAYRESISS